MVAPVAGSPTAGLVLAGGGARRMGGGDKPLLALAGRPLLDRVLARLGPQADPILLSANGDPERYARYGLPVVADGGAESEGPLAGVVAGLDWLATHRPDIAWLASVAGDTPFLPRDLVPRLHEARLRAGTPLACAASGGRAHPVNALWPVALRDDLRAALASGERKIDRWTARHGCAAAAWPSEPLDPFFNVNRPDDLAEAERCLASIEAP